MSLTRTPQTFLSPATSILRSISSSSPSTTSQICPYCNTYLYLRSLSYTRKLLSSRQYSNRQRYLHTATAYRPYRLDQTSIPPRSTGVPDTSIAGGIPVVDGDSRKNNDEDLTASLSLTEGEAQKSKPADDNVSAAFGRTTESLDSGTEIKKSSLQPESPKISTASFNKKQPKRSSLLRPRRSAISLSSSAVTQLRNLLDQPEPKLIRVGVRNRGCSGLAYHLEYVDKPGTFDESVEQDGVKVLVDSKALFSIIGSEMDWVEDKLNRRFVFRNPNIKEQCGCGESFSVG